MFGNHKKQQISLDELLSKIKLPAPVVNVYQPPIQIVRENEYRPCWVQGKKALFHRWANDARPTLPGNQKFNENARFYQFRSSKAIVEYEDGTVARVWPNEVKFADSDFFHQFEWEAEGDGNADDV